MSIRRSVVVLRADNPTSSGSAPPDPSPPHNHRLSPGVIAGISIGAAVAVFGLMAIVSLVVSGHRRRKMRERSKSGTRDPEEEVKIELPPPHQLRHLTTESSSVALLLHVEERRSSADSAKKKGKAAGENREGGYLRQGYMSISLEDPLPAYSVPLSIPDTQPKTSSQTYLESTSNVTGPAQPPSPSPHSPSSSLHSPLFSPHSPLSPLHSPLPSPQPPHIPLPNPYDIHLPNPHQDTSSPGINSSGDIQIEPTDTVVVSPLALKARSNHISDPPPLTGTRTPHVEQDASLSTIHPSEYPKTHTDTP